MAKIWPVPHPRRWGLRVRSALIVTVAVAAGMAAFTLALTAVLYHSLIGAANDAVGWRRGITAGNPDGEPMPGRDQAAPAQGCGDRCGQ